MMNDEKRLAGAYEILYAIHIGDKEIVFGENPDMGAPTRYFAAGVIRAISMNDTSEMKPATI